MRTLASKVRKAVKKWVYLNPAISHKRLAGACGIASYTLYRALKRKGYSPILACWVSKFGGHAWVELGNIVIDVTATQFGRYPAVHIVGRNQYDVIEKREGEIVYNRKAVRCISTWHQQNHTQYQSEIVAFVKALD